MAKTDEKIERLSRAVSLYTDTRMPVYDILKETHISSSELYKELKATRTPLRGLSGWQEELSLSEDETKQVIGQLVNGVSMYSICKQQGLERSTIYRAVTERLLNAMKDGEDVRLWLP